MRVDTGSPAKVSGHVQAEPGWAAHKLPHREAGKGFLSWASPQTLGVVHFLPAQMASGSLIRPSASCFAEHLLCHQAYDGDKRDMVPVLMQCAAKNLTCNNSTIRH